jgi:hypothetical protein
MRRKSFYGIWNLKLLEKLNKPLGIHHIDIEKDYSSASLNNFLLLILNIKKKRKKRRRND